MLLLQGRGVVMDERLTSKLRVIDPLDRRHRRRSATLALLVVHGVVQH